MQCCFAFVDESVHFQIFLLLFVVVVVVVAAHFNSNQFENPLFRTPSSKLLKLEFFIRVNLNDAAISNI